SRPAGAACRLLAPPLLHPVLRSAHMRRRIFLSCLFYGALAAPAFALERRFPDNVKRGRMTTAPWPRIIIDGQPRQLSPGAQVRNRNNLIEMPDALRGADLPINYTETEQGEIHRVWILTPAEAEQPLPKQ